MNVLQAYDNVTVLYGHIHRDDEHVEGHVHNYAARSLIFAFPEPTAPVKKPYPFDKDQPFKHLGIRVVSAAPQRPIAVQDVELTLREYSGLNGIQQILKSPKL